MFKEIKAISKNYAIVRFEGMGSEDLPEFCSDAPF